MKKIIDYLKYQYYLFRTYPKRRMFPKYKILSIEETIREVVEKKKSISRLGDADFLLLIEARDVSYHKLHPVLSQKLKAVLQSNNSQFIVALPDAIVDRRKLHKNARAHWVDFINMYGATLATYIPVNKVYGNSNMTRFYVDTLDEVTSERYFEQMKQIWHQKDVIIVEGEFSRLGIGNDLFDNAKSVKRIIGPSRDAFFKYQELLEELVKFPKDTQFLFALGPTASVLCYELALLGYWAIDIGNIDMEYMWFKAKAKGKISIRGRYHVETDNSQPVDLLPEDQIKYDSSIICKIGI